MKIFKTLISSLVILFCVSSAYSANDTIAARVDNFVISGGGTKFSFDVFVLRLTPDDFRMGNSSFYFNFTPTLCLGNPVLSNINPKYTSPNLSYGPMVAVPFPPSFGLIGIQVFRLVTGPGEIITNVPGNPPFGEKLATVTMDILIQVPNAVITWDLANTNIVDPTNVAAQGQIFNGNYNGPLPVELSSFTSTINTNNVTLNWTTVSEINNHGFDIERKTNDVNSNWSKVGFVNGSGTSTESRTYTFRDNGLSSGGYYYRLKQIDFNGNFEYFGLENEVVVGVPTRFELSQNYPNPFNPSTKINFSLPTDSRVSLNIYDMSGRLVSTLINNEFKTANYYTVDFSGSNISSGTYFYTIQTDNFRETKKMVLVK